MTKTLYSISLLFLLALGAGCQDSASPISQVEGDQEALLTGFSAHLLAPTSFTDEALSPEERKFIAKHSVPDQVRMTEIIIQATSWEEAHQGILDLLAEESPLPRYVRAQRAAVFMLKATRVLDSITDAQREGIAMYVDMLAEYRSPEAGVMLEALEHLKGYWSEEKIRYAASRGVEGADTYLNRKFYCKECPGSAYKMTSTKPTRPTQDAFVNELLSSVEPLRLLAEPAGK